MVTSFGVALQHLLFKVLLYVLDYPFPALCKFLLDFSEAKLLRCNELFSIIKNENINSATRDISLSVNGLVYHIGVCAKSVTYLAFLIENKKFIKSLKKMRKKKRIKTVTLFLVAHQYLLFSMLLHLIIFFAALYSRDP